MAVIIALGNGKDLGFMYFQLFPGLEGTDPGGQLEAPRLEILESVATIFHQVSLQQVI